MQMEIIWVSNTNHYLCAFPYEEEWMCGLVWKQKPAIHSTYSWCLLIWKVKMYEPFRINVSNILTVIFPMWKIQIFDFFNFFLKNLLKTLNNSSSISLSVKILIFQFLKWGKHWSKLFIFIYLVWVYGTLVTVSRHLILQLLEGGYLYLFAF